MTKRLFGFIVMAASGGALVWLGYNIVVDEIPSFLRLASDPDKLMKWTWPLAFAALGGLFLSMQRSDDKKKPKKA